MFADTAAVAVFQFPPQTGGAFRKLPLRQVGGFLKGKFLFGAIQAAARLVALIIDGTAQIPLPLPTPACHPVLQHHRLDETFDDFEYSRLIVRYQQFGLHRQLQPGLPPGTAGLHGLPKYLEFHLLAPFAVW